MTPEIQALDGAHRRTCSQAGRIADQHAQVDGSRSEGRRRKTSTASAKMAPSTISIIAAIAIVVALAVAFLLARAIATPVRGMTRGHG